MSRFAVVTVVVAVLASLAAAQPPSGYYDAVDRTSNVTLHKSLCAIIRTNHSDRGYSAIWTFFAEHGLDDFYEDDQTILDMYSENPAGPDAYEYEPTVDKCGSYKTEGDCYNREHSFPKSWFGNGSPMHNDVTHIFPTDGKVNGMRSNYPYGNVDPDGARYISDNGSRLGAGAASWGFDGTVFEPIDAFKGDVARAYFYMATRYCDVIASWQHNSDNSEHVLDGSSDQVFTGWQLNTLLNWAARDPVSQREIDRNNAVFNYQGNRNPFIDGFKPTDIWSQYPYPTPSMATAHDAAASSPLSRAATAAAATIAINGEPSPVLLK